MNRLDFLNQLDHYTAFDTEEESMRRRMREFVAGHDDCFRRALLIGHITASCWVLDKSRTNSLLTWHKRLNRWLQMGGHVEPEDSTLLAAATRELREESGLTCIRPVSDHIFDLDIHLIPARKREPEHLHYDVRFLIQADPAEPVHVSPESRELAWVALTEIAALNADSSIARMVAKSGNTNT